MWADPAARHMRQWALVGTDGRRSALLWTRRLCDRRYAGVSWWGRMFQGPQRSPFHKSPWTSFALKAATAVASPPGDVAVLWRPPIVANRHHSRFGSTTGRSTPFNSMASLPCYSRRDCCDGEDARCVPTTRQQTQRRVHGRAPCSHAITSTGKALQSLRCWKER